MEINEALIRSLFPDIYEPEARAAILENGHLMEIKAGELLMDIGSYIKFMPLVLKGSLKILREDQEGNELLLYYIHAGETCAMSLICCMGDSKSTIRAVADEETQFLALPVRLMDDWTTRFRSFKGFIMLSYQRRYDELLRTIDGIAFQKLDDRLWAALKEKFKQSGKELIQTTHQELAQELNSSREVISRLLKQLERKGVIRLGRNKIELLQKN
ncbi:MAG: Crp/Fnr family transcriptional regulator [Flavobacteriales bacterium]|jgi:CRP/FNR family transcriptional regulator